MIAIQQGRRLRQAFTLIEVLVVVAIIALLLAVLLPSLARARQVSKLSVCLHNHKMLGQGAMMYAQESRDYVPPPDPSQKDIGPVDNTSYYKLGADCMGVYFPKWVPALDMFICPGAGNRVERRDERNDIGSNGGLAGPNGMIDDLENSYVSNADGRRGMCYEYIPFLYNVVYYPDGSPNPDYKQYNLNYELSRSPQVRPLRVNLVRRPGTLVIAHDDDAPGRNWFINDLEDPHGVLGKGNMLYADGHAVSIGWQEWNNWTDRGRPRVRR